MKMGSERYILSLSFAPAPLSKLSVCRKQLELYKVTPVQRRPVTARCPGAATVFAVRAAGVSGSHCHAGLETMTSLILISSDSVT